MALRACRVWVTDLEGTTHSVSVKASTLLFEAAAEAIRTFSTGAVGGARAHGERGPANRSTGPARDPRRAAEGGRTLAQRTERQPQGVFGKTADLRDT